MAQVIIPQRWKARRGTEAALTSANEVLLAGELCFETDTGNFKIGDGATAWNSLSYQAVHDLTDLRRILDLLGSTAEGDIIYKGPSGWTRLAKGTNGHVLKLSSGLPVWAAESGGGGGGGGAIVQVKRSTPTATTYTTTATIPGDNTIPQNTEGDALGDFDVTITPASASNDLWVDLFLPLISSSGSNIGVRFVIFRDSGADAIFATSRTGDQGIPAHISCVVPAGSTAATTFKLRWGVSSGTGYINRISTAAALFGGVMKAYMKVSEITP